MKLRRVLRSLTFLRSLLLLFPLIVAAVETRDVENLTQAPVNLTWAILSCVE